ncbi:unnamed protein product [Tilletia caries]|nr:unnamed protein product [Tilletia caries]
MARGYALQHPLLRATSTSHHHLATTSSAVATASCPIAQPPRPVGLTVRSLRPILGPGVTNSLRTSTSSASLRVRSSLGWGAPSSVRMPGAWDALADYENAPTKSPELEFGVAMRQVRSMQLVTIADTPGLQPLRMLTLPLPTTLTVVNYSDDATSAASSVPSASTAVTLAAVDLSTVYGSPSSHPKNVPSTSSISSLQVPHNSETSSIPTTSPPTPSLPSRAATVSQVGPPPTTVWPLTNSAPP